MVDGDCAELAAAPPHGRDSPVLKEGPQPVGIDIKDEFEGEDRGEEEVD